MDVRNDPKRERVTERDPRVIELRELLDWEMDPVERQRLRMRLAALYAFGYLPGKAKR